MQDLTQALIELIRRTSTDLPPDVQEALKKARKREERGSAAQSALDTILDNVEPQEFHAHLPGHRDTHLLRAPS
jgi:fumarate hydratase, class I